MNNSYYKYIFILPSLLYSDVITLMDDAFLVNYVHFYGDRIAPPHGARGM